MSIIDFVKRSYLTHFSKPQGRRLAYRLVSKQPTRLIVQLGLNDLDFVENLLWVARQKAPGNLVRFVGVDLFEMRGPEQTPLSLKDAHQRLGATEAKVKLVPGDPLAALSRNANSLTDTDLLLVTGMADPDSMQQAWFYVPRMLQSRSLVLRQDLDAPEESYEMLPTEEVDRLSVNGYAARRRAA